MKVVAVMEASPTGGGGFYQALNAVLQMKRICAGRIAFEVGAVHPGAREVLAGFGIESFDLPISLFDRLRLQSVSARSPIRQVLGWLAGHRLHQLHRLLRRLPDIVPLEKSLKRRGADLVYFVTPWMRVHRLRFLSHWVTVWDLAHVEFGEFPEVAPVVRLREGILNGAFLRASLVIADSEQSKKLIAHRYGLESDRVIPMPFLPAPNVDSDDSTPSAEVLANFGLERGYLFYPAQFWAHKNHVRILEAVKLCAEKGLMLRVVFAGGNMGSLPHVESVVAKLGLQHSVRLLGFVDARFMRGLYEGSLAVVMPTYFGPTNLPPLEAWSSGVPLIYSKHLAEQAGDAALLIDPDDAKDLAAALTSIQDASVRDRLIANGFRRLQELDIQRRLAEQALQDRLGRLEARLRCSTAN